MKRNNRNRVCMAKNASVSIPAPNLMVMTIISRNLSSRAMTREPRFMADPLNMLCLESPIPLFSSLQIPEPLKPRLDFVVVQVVTNGFPGCAIVIAFDA